MVIRAVETPRTFRYSAVEPGRMGLSTVSTISSLKRAATDRLTGRVDTDADGGCGAGLVGDDGSSSGDEQSPDRQLHPRTIGDPLSSPAGLSGAAAKTPRRIGRRLGIYLDSSHSDASG